MLQGRLLAIRVIAQLVLAPDVKQEDALTMGLLGQAIKQAVALFFAFPCSNMLHFHAAGMLNAGPDPPLH